MGTGADMNRVAFGRRLNAIRRERQVSSEKLSELCGINAVFVRQIESASRRPSLPVFVRMCNELRVLPNFLLQDSLLWEGEDEIAALEKKLRALSPRDFSAVMGTINTLIDKLSFMEEQE